MLSCCYVTSCPILRTRNIDFEIFLSSFADLIHPGRSWWVKQVVIEKCISALLNFGLPPDLNDVAAAPSTVSKVLVNLRMIGGTSMEVI